jgi:hypothetical protein
MQATLMVIPSFTVAISVGCGEGIQIIRRDAAQRSGGLSRVTLRSITIAHLSSAGGTFRSRDIYGQTLAAQKHWSPVTWKGVQWWKCLKLERQSLLAGAA